jgi:hypothetical protein
MKQFYIRDIPLLCEVPLTESGLVVVDPRLINLISRPLQVSRNRAEPLASGHPFSRCTTAQSPATSGRPTMEMALLSAVISASTIGSHTFIHTATILVMVAKTCVIIQFSSFIKVLLYSKNRSN